MKYSTGLMFFAAWFAAVLHAADGAVPFELKDRDCVALLGGTFVERLQNEGYFETELTAAFPQKHLTFRNLGWSGDTVWGDSRGVFGDRADGFRRLVNDTLNAKPTVLAIAYGQNEAFAGEDGLEPFRDGLRQLLDALAPSQARVVLIAPPKALPVLPPLPPVDGYNRNLAKYRTVIQEVAKERRVAFLDWYDLERDSKNRIHPSAMTSNGHHWTPAVEWLFAPQMAQSFGAPRDPFEIQIRIDSKTQKVTADASAVSVINSSQQGLAVLIHPPRIQAAGFSRAVGVKIEGLVPGRYRITFRNGEQVSSLEQPIDGEKVFYNPDVRDAEKLRRVIREKNALFFHRYRPQNETYLFLFRKHEQGNNAVEIPQYDPLIAAKEQEIAELRQPKPFTLEITRMGS